jgi:hypothetical protein
MNYRTRLHARPYTRFLPRRQTIVTAAIAIRDTLKKEHRFFFQPTEFAKMIGVAR